MTEDELIDRILNRKHLEQQEDRPVAPSDPASEMTESEVRKYCVFLLEQVPAKDKMLGDILNELKELRKENSSENKSLREMISALKAQLASSEKKNRLLEKTNEDLSSRLSVVNGVHFGSSKSQKGIHKQSVRKGRNDDKDNFDGTSGSISSEGVDNSALGPM